MANAAETVQNDNKIHFMSEKPILHQYPTGTVLVTTAHSGIHHEKMWKVYKVDTNKTVVKR